MFCDEFVIHSSFLFIFLKIIILSNFVEETHEIIKKNTSTLRKPIEIPIKKSDENSSGLDISDSKFDTNIFLSPILDPILYVQINVDPEKQVTFNTTGKSAFGTNNRLSKLNDFLSNYSIPELNNLIHSNMTGTSANDICSALRQYLETFKKKQNYEDNTNLTAPKNDYMSQLQEDFEFNRFIKHNNSNNFIKNIIRRNKKSPSITNVTFRSNNNDNFQRYRTNEEMNKSNQAKSIISKNLSDTTFSNNERPDSSIKQLLLKAFGPDRYDESGILSYNVYPLINNRISLKGSDQDKYRTNIFENERKIFKKDNKKKLMNDELRDGNKDYKDGTEDKSQKDLNNNNDKMQLEGISEIKNRTEEKQEPFNLAKEIIDSNEMINGFSSNNIFKKKRNEIYSRYNNDFALTQNISKFKRSNIKTGNMSNKDINCTQNNNVVFGNEMNRINPIKENYERDVKEKDSREDFKNSNKEDNAIAEFISQIDTGNNLPIMHDKKLRRALVNEFRNSEIKENYKPYKNEVSQYYEGEEPNWSRFTIPSATKQDAFDGLLHNKPQKIKSESAKYRTMLLKELNDKYLHNIEDDRIEAKSDGNYDDSDEYDSWAGNKKHKTKKMNKEKAITVSLVHNDKNLGSYNLKHNNLAKEGDKLTTRVIELINSKKRMGVVHKTGLDKLLMKPMTPDVDGVSERFYNTMIQEETAGVNNKVHVIITDTTVIVDQSTENRENLSNLSDENVPASQKVKFASLSHKKKIKTNSLKAGKVTVASKKSTSDETLIEDGISPDYIPGTGCHHKLAIIKTERNGTLNDQTKRRNGNVKLYQSHSNKKYERQNITTHLSDDNEDLRGYSTITFVCQTAKNANNGSNSNQFINNILVSHNFNTHKNNLKYKRDKKLKIKLQKQKIYDE